ncbi:hypothetical protein OROMI_010805 [Orobanche minor]
MEKSAKKMTDPLIGPLFDVGQSSKKFSKRDYRKSSDSVATGRFRAYVGGLGTGGRGTAPAEIDRALRLQFENCGEIEGINVNDLSWSAYINFPSLESLLKALQLNKTSFCGHPLKVYRVNTNKSTFRASIRCLDTGLDMGARKLDVLLALRDHFKICGEIEYIFIVSPKYACIDFASLASLHKALEFNNTKVCDHLVAVAKEFNHMGNFRAEIHGLDTGADAEKVEGALREHFKECGRIEGISANAGYAYIDFASLGSLFKALELNNTKVGDHTITVRQPGIDSFHTSEFMAGITYPGYVDLNALRSHFEKCGVIAGISYSCTCAVIYFTKMDALKNALELDGSCIGNNEITVKVSGLDVVGNNEITVKKCGLDVGGNNEIIVKKCSLDVGGSGRLGSVGNKWGGGN